MQYLGRQYQAMEIHPLTFTYEDYINNGYSLSNLIIDKYIVYSIIGKGSCGNVYRGFDDETKKQVAVKVIDLLKIQNQRPLSRAIRKRLAQSEPKLMKICDSPHVIKCLDVYQNQHLKILILQHCNGKTLQQEINEKGLIPQYEAIGILRHIIKGLAELHKHKIIHRDLKSQNIMSHNGIYKIIDFGFSKKLQIFNYEAEINLTALGTRTTMAPEVFSKKPYGLKADIWSLGIIFFEMIYGKVPYNSISATEFYQEIAAKKYFNHQIPLTLNNITPSKLVHKFLCDTIQIQTLKRLDWKELANHPLIANIEQYELNQRFIEQVSVIDPKLNCDEMIHAQNTSTFDEKKKPKLDASIGSYSNNEKKVEISKEEHNAKQQLDQAKVNKDKQKLNVDVAESSQKHFKIDPHQKPASQTEKMPKPNKSKFKLDISYNQDQDHSKNESVQQKPNKSIGNLKSVDMKEDKQMKQANQKKEDKDKKENKQMKHNKDSKDNQIKVDEKKVHVIKINEKELNSKKVEIQKYKQEDEEQYKWVQQIHLECLKTEVIYRDLIKQIQTEELLDLSDRSCVEYLYLLSARCFNNMSPIKYRLENSNIKQPIIENLDKQVSNLYNIISQNFIKYSSMLTTLQNRKRSIFADFFLRKIEGQQYKAKYTFLTGVQIVDYEKIQQIHFTDKNYTDRICQNLVKKPSYTKVLKYILAYPNICSVSLKQLDTLTFQRYTVKLIG